MANRNVLQTAYTDHIDKITAAMLADWTGNLNDIHVRSLRYFGFAPAGADNTSHYDNDLLPYLQTRGGTIGIPPGIWEMPPMTGARALPQFTNFVGAGRGASVLHLPNGSNADFVNNHQSTGGADPVGKIISLQHLTLDCNKANQSSGRGVYFTCPTPGAEPAADWAPDGQFLLRDLEIRNAKGDGCGNTGGSEMRYENVWARGCDGNGFVPNYDSWLGSCTAEKSGLHGFKLAYGSLGLHNCKAFYSGTVNVSSASAGGAGLYIVSAGATGGVVVSNFRAQDNGTNGVYAEGDGATGTGRWVVIQGLLCDSNGWGRTGALATPGTWVGLSLWDCQYLQVSGFASFDRVVDHGAGARVTQSNALSLNASGAGRGHHVYVDGVHAGMITSQDASMGAAVKTFNTTNVTSSRVTLNGTTTTS